MAHAVLLFFCRWKFRASSRKKTPSKDNKNHCGDTKNLSTFLKSVLFVAIAHWIVFLGVFFYLFILFFCATRSDERSQLFFLFFILLKHLLDYALTSLIWVHRSTLELQRIRRKISSAFVLRFDRWIILIRHSFRTFVHNFLFLREESQFIRSLNAYILRNEFKSESLLSLHLHFSSTFCVVLWTENSNWTIEMCVCVCCVDPFVSHFIGVRFTIARVDGDGMKWSFCSNNSIVFFNRKSTVFFFYGSNHFPSELIYDDFEQQ